MTTEIESTEVITEIESTIVITETKTKAATSFDSQEEELGEAQEASITEDELKIEGDSYQPKDVE